MRPFKENSLSAKIVRVVLELAKVKEENEKLLMEKAALQRDKQCLENLLQSKQRFEVKA